MKINHDGGHVFHDGKCQRCEMLESRFYDLDSPTRGQRCTGHAEKAGRMFIEDELMTNITMPGVTLKNESYRGFIISWQEPPMMGRWTANVASDLPNLLALMRQNGSKVIDGRDHDDMIAAAKKYIDDLLG